MVQIFGLDKSEAFRTIQEMSKNRNKNPVTFIRINYIIAWTQISPWVRKINTELYACVIYWVKISLPQGTHLVVIYYDPSTFGITQTFSFVRYEKNGLTQNPLVSN